MLQPIINQYPYFFIFVTPDNLYYIYYIPESIIHLVVSF